MTGLRMMICCPHSSPEGPPRPPEVWLEFHRTTLVRKCEGRSDEQAAGRSAHPSALTLTAFSSTWPKSNAIGSAGYPLRNQLLPFMILTPTRQLATAFSIWPRERHGHLPPRSPWTVSPGAEKKSLQTRRNPRQKLQGVLP